MSAVAPSTETPSKHKRIEAIDFARGLALVAMAIYHFSWDLEFFGYLDPGTTAFGGWKLFARSIASSFLVLVGISLYLAHGKGVRWRPFLMRLAMIAGAALAITVVTYLAVPSGFIFFGILHEIALASLLGLAFLRLPAIVTAGVAVLVIAIPWFAGSTFFDHPAFWWVGLSTIPPHSNDYVPVFPWFGAVLAGIALAQLPTGFGLMERLAAVPLPGTTPLQFIGRHSLGFYLIHQPVLIAAVWIYAQFAPAEQQPPEVQFRNACEAQCRPVRDEEFCARYCVCMLDELERNGIKEQVLTNDLSAPLTAQLQNLAGSCTAQTDEEMGGAQ
ncbi:heparan-alpha-glucosaminide N-acetyltransferase [Mesorhizobium sp. BAC0120]|uniref:heparan-alpha-glucosaminide N-acetyltransferase n=1 Tax=Mesorhizobium sp. BAC0120 TaxID=3090670 RepID=UPI00298CBC6C|nr:heparan-alpha-glucosaminide N-acetyltransferase [Mesorhizobium sp. BAC0120]MDW6020327.1 heparan-alpha-glucosaminide N-acetyltransferase [Mesorhizobium sp. BAC0120]